MSNDDAELAELRAKCEAIALQRQQRAEKEERALELLQAKQRLEDEQAIDAAEREHGVRRIAVVETEGGAVIVKRPHANTFRKFQDKGTTDSQALETLVRPCLVHPTLARFESICAEEPAVLLRVANAVSRLAGVRAEELSGKS